MIPWYFATEPQQFLLNADTDVLIEVPSLRLDLELENMWFAHDGAAILGWMQLLVGGRPYSPIVKIVGTLISQFGDPVRQLPLGLVVPAGSDLGARIRPTATVNGSVTIWGNLIDPRFDVRPSERPSVGTS